LIYPNVRLSIRLLPLPIYTFVLLFPKSKTMALGEEIVSHPGVIRKIEGSRAEVSIIAKAGCISCSLNNVCSVSDVQEKIVEVDLYPNNQLCEGDEVVIEMKQSYGSWAVILGYFLPFLVLFFGLIVFLQLGLNQGLSGLAAIALLVPYYGGLFLMKGFFKKRFLFHIK